MVPRPILRSSRPKLTRWTIAMRRCLSTTVLLTLATVLSGCNLVVLDPKGPIGISERSIIYLATALMLIIVIPVIAMIFAFAWQYRASNTRATYTPNWDTSHKIAVVVALVTCSIVLWLAILTWRTSHTLDPYRPLASATRPITIDVVALDWKWLFIYPELNIASVNEVAFPANVPVNFRITASSVMNSFFIPQLGGQIYAMPGMQTKLSLIAGEAGSYDGMSANYSGAGFSDMKFKAVATSVQGFQDWVAKAASSSDHLSGDAYKALARPSEKSPVAYFSSVDPGIYPALLRMAENKAFPICSARKD